MMQRRVREAMKRKFVGKHMSAAIRRQVEKNLTPKGRSRNTTGAAILMVAIQDKITLQDRRLPEGTPVNKQETRDWLEDCLEAALQAEWISAAEK